jgi:hypothetical protein
MPSSPRAAVTAAPWLLAQGRVWFGVKLEIVALTEIPYVKGARARLLYRAGLRTPEAVAASEVDKIAEIMSAGALPAPARAVAAVCRLLAC